MNIRKLAQGILSLNNAKLNHLGNRLGVRVIAFDLQAGFTCPAASLCHSRAIETSEGIRIADYGEFRCYAASQEAQYKNTRLMRQSNYELTQNLPLFIETISHILESGKIQIVRIHASGDFYHPRYYQAWRTIASRFPQVNFFAYTKMANIAKDIQQVNPMQNFKVVYSMGGKMDRKAIEWRLITCTVVTSDYEVIENPNASESDYFINPLASSKRLQPITCNKIVSNDYEAVMSQESFGILLHGTQPKK